MTGFDVAVAVMLLGLASWAVTSRDPMRCAVLFVVFGLVMALAWVRLDAPDIALAEAAVGAGLTGGLLIDTARALGPGRRVSGGAPRGQSGGAPRGQRGGAPRGQSGGAPRGQR
jgi:uncharacterized MnhB-related membrane protein